ncbi:hypothetical protein COMNV_00856 [Commensalibacter sp. Nvir]|uniref:hypothetical protein n=1 Tax=Commensalibacter sp. Nvir TaxID=3069817 RepID=UPI002D6C140F|nr:hypothetical protein COMNV_00856 [Commensalibacter sp. Nvir]
MDIKNNNNSSPMPIPGSFIMGKEVSGNKIQSDAHFYLPKGEYIVKMKTTFTVPSIPTDTTGNYFLYLWPGIASATAGILQPVLAFHSTYPSWYLHTYAIAPAGSSTPHQQGKDYDIAVGTELTGVIELTDKTDSAYTYKVYFEGYPDETSCSQTWEVPSIVAYQFIEPWYVTKRAQFPQEDTLEMRNIELYTNTGQVTDVKWVTDNPKVVCTSDKVILPYWNK